jgi:hypothetical protein
MMGGSGYVPQTDGSGPGRTKNLRILRIRNTAGKPPVMIFFIDAFAYLGVSFRSYPDLQQSTELKNELVLRKIPFHP